ncbi:MAG: hypothetical protein ABS46_02310 [Cytophagaceae bacterium SCN 52-12]|nr:MAG: hypothetical protein ABS46_02310 [Cytophagaceae bacterium SCN 52-12]
MRNEIREWLENQEFRFNEDAIRRTCDSRERNPGHMAIRVLVILGTLLSAGLIVSMLFSFGIYDSAAAMLITGITGLVAGMWNHLKRQSDVTDTISISLLLMGYASIAFALVEWKVDTGLICGALIMISLACFILSKNFILPFLGLVSACICLFIWVQAKCPPVFIPLLYSVLAAALLPVYLYEGNLLVLLRKKASSHYQPLRTGLLVSVLAGLYIFSPFFLKGSQEFPFKHYQLYFSVPVSLICLLAVARLLQETQSALRSWKIAVFPVIALVLGLTLFAPAIGLSLYLLVITFYNAHKTGIIISIVSLCFAIGLYYYDLHFSLLVKSMLMILPGLVFLAGYRLVTREER